MFESTTANIRIEVHPAFEREQSDPRQNHYFFSYRIRISNVGPVPMKLLSRHWIITDAFGKTEEVQGPGVIGLQPTVKPGETFEYSSFCPLETPTGSMKGSYVMADPKGVEIQVAIPQFVLSEPNHYH
jgi:ApaG protein